MQNIFKKIRNKFFPKKSPNIFSDISLDEVLAHSKSEQEIADEIYNLMLDRLALHIPGVRIFANNYKKFHEPKKFITIDPGKGKDEMVFSNFEKNKKGELEMRATYGLSPCAEAAKEMLKHSRGDNS